MNPFEDLPPESTDEPPVGDPPFAVTEEPFESWLAKPGSGEAILEAMERLMAEKLGEMSPEEAEEVKDLHRQLRLEFADSLLSERYNPLADRLRDLIAVDCFGEEEVEELGEMAAELRSCIDMALDLDEPRRTEVIAILRHSQEAVNRMVETWYARMDDAKTP